MLQLMYINKFFALSLLTGTLIHYWSRDTVLKGSIFNNVISSNRGYADNSKYDQNDPNWDRYTR